LSGINGIASIIIPAFFILSLEYASGRAKEFDFDQVQGINELVLDFALPAALFIGTVTTSRAMLLQLGPFFLTITWSMVGLYAVILVLGRTVFHLNLGSAALLETSKVIDLTRQTNNCSPNSANVEGARRL